jgi:hypothetical protein
MNYYLKFRKKKEIQATQRFMLSLMSIGVVFVLYSVTARALGGRATDWRDPLHLWSFAVSMALIVPIISMEIVLWFYTNVVVKAKK